MKKADRPSPWGGTNRDRARGSGWMNWYINHKRLNHREPNERLFKQAVRRLSWRRVL